MTKFKLLLIVAAFLTCITTSSRAADGTPPTDACALLTPAQVSGILGVAVGAGKTAIKKFCQWDEAPGRAGEAKKKVLLILLEPGAFAYAKTPVGSGVTKVPVSGVGDDAVYGTNGRMPTELTVKKGKVVFGIHVSGFPDDQIKAMEKALALEVLAKL